MSAVELHQVRGPAVELKPSLGPKVELAIARFAVEITTKGIKGDRGPLGTLAYDQIANVLQGQKTFNLLLLPADPAMVRMIVNGTSYAAPLISVAGQQVTWSEPFTLDGADTVEFQYPVQETP